MSGISEDALLQAWAKTLAAEGERAAIFDTRGEVLRTFREIEARAREFCERFGDLKAGEVVALQIGNHPDWPAWLLACLRKKLVTLPLERAMTAQESEAAWRICRARAVIEAVEAGIAVRRLDSSPNEWCDHVPSLLKLTSGTTAAPRAIRFRSAQLLADCEQICDTMGITARDHNFGVIPFSHSYGFSNLITPLLARGVALVLSQDRMPRAVLDDLARTNATVFPGMPVFYQAFTEMNDAPALPKLRLCISAGAPLSGEVARKFREKFRLPIHSFYGSSECGGICYDGEGADESGFLGTPMRGVALEFLGSESPSRVRVRSAAVGDGYFPETDEEKLGHGIFVPDDLISGDETTGLRLVGRTSDIINVAGKKVNPVEVEAQLLRFDGVEQAIVFGCASERRNEEVTACVVAKAKVEEAALLEFCRERLSGWQVPKRIFFLREIPVNERGKTSRRDLARRFARERT